MPLFKNFHRACLSALVTAVACTVAIQSLHADDPVPATNGAPVATAPPSPVFLNRAPLGQLRPAEADSTASPGSMANFAPLPDPSSSAAANPLPSSPTAPNPELAANTPAPSSPTTAISDAPQLATSADGSPTLPSDSQDTSAAPATSGDSGNAWKGAYVNLVNLLVQRGVLTKKDSGSLITQAEQAAKSEQTAQAPVPGPGATPSGDQANPDDDTVRVTYVPESVKAQIRDEVKDDVMKQARDENWATPNTIPDWVSRYHLSADLRIRYEGDRFPDGNDDLGDFHNFNAINTGSPFDDGIHSVGPNPPTYDTDEDRDRFRLRARFGAAVDVGQGFTAGLRVGTGQDDNPVTENQTLGLANNGQGGNFSKYAIWLDRAFLRYDLGETPDKSFSALIGRFENPFFSSPMIWAKDIGFDGLMFQGKYKVAEGVTPFITVGGFPVFNTDLNFSSTSAAKFNSEDKYLFAGQVGTTWQISKDISFKAAASIYYFENIEGKVSDPFIPLTSSDQGDTDDSRPSFAQNGNTYIALRDITPDASNGNGTTNQFQYFGLATPFHEAALTWQFDFSHFDPFHISLQGEVVKNFAFDRSDIEHNGPPQQIGPVNNVLTPGDPSSFRGGDTGYNIRLQLGRPVLEKLWDWNVDLTYRYVETDATVDAFTDADFGGPLVGTNLKGYIIGGNLALTSRVWTSLQWMSADAIDGPVYKNDLIQVDINAKF